MRAILQMFAKALVIGLISSGCDQKPTGLTKPGGGASGGGPGDDRPTDPVSAIVQDYHGEDPAILAAQNKAKQGDAGGEFRLGIYYLTGGTGIEDAYKATNLLIRAATQGYCPAQLTMFRLLLDGGVMVKDAPSAIDWLTQAYWSLDSDALLRFFDTKHTPYDKSRLTERNYRQWLILKAAEDGFVPAEECAAFMYYYGYYGTGTVANQSKGLDYMIRVCRETEPPEELGGGVFSPAARARLAEFRLAGGWCFWAFPQFRCFSTAIGKPLALPIDDAGKLLESPTQWQRFGARC